MEVRLREIIWNVLALTDVSIPFRISVRTMWSIEAEELKKESYGVELLHTVGFVYQSKSKSVSPPPLPPIPPYH